MGRAFARQHASELGVPDDPRHWSDDALLVALLSHGDDLPGDFVIGEAAAARAHAALVDGDRDAVRPRARRERYGEMAEAALLAGPVGSSAGGEQPKFTARVAERSGDTRSVIVKFSPPLQTAAGRRWADLLVTELLASEVLREHGFAASRVAWIAGPRRAFLEVTRFDRVGTHGRRGFVSLLPLDAELYGALDSWPAAAARLLRDGWLTLADSRALEELWWFGRLIGNTDLHFGNVALWLRDAPPFALAPVYDMLPMAHQPTTTGEIVLREQRVELPPPEALPAWRRAAEIAARFWETVVADARISAAFRAETRGRAAAILRAASRLG